jgi:hypothetical protein
MRVFAEIERISRQLRAQEKRPSLVKPPGNKSTPGTNKPKASGAAAGR